MRPLDPRLLRVASAARALLAGTGVIALVQAVAIVVFAWSASLAIAIAIGGADGDLWQPLTIAAAAIVARSALGWVDQAIATRGSVRVRSQLRARALARIGETGVADPVVAATGIGRGLDALDGYLAGFVPQLARTVVAVPIVLVALFVQDPFSGVAAALCLPLIPVFMVLIGLATQRVQRAQWRETERLAAATLDTLEGLATLKLFRRDRRARALVEARSAEHGTRTMSVLRISFLSSLVLELAGSIAIAIVAVSVGVRLLEGDIPLAVAFSVLILVPDAFLPVRLVGIAFHASTEGVEATTRVLDLLEREPAEAPAAADADAAASGLVLSGLRARHGGGAVTAVLPHGTLACLHGPSGVGKSSVLAALLGLVDAHGAASLDGRAVARADLAWAPQRSADALVSGTVRSNVALGGDDAHVDEAMALAGVDLDPDLPVDPATGGVHGASGGQVQRVVLARAIRRHLDGAPVLLVDEPTSALDAEHERHVVASLRALADAGGIVVVASHRAAVVAAADAVVEPVAIEVPADAEVPA
ncbi:ABC transporter ATP-binding protein/permease [Agrococcus jejuensis]|uniref:ATP-binding cassette, subfamily C, CydD n=1 Tax=Agrococcus jejuensis TaxID=399736 RepID=A0A1G8A5I0_9MICO|nr:ABC transporter transmembrane domain-containing protein [Agrococcus jejuensis]SDH16188.1 ATP-binding cassette, subfamily C, CydD [Agrococcus jejuensis]